MIFGNAFLRWVVNSSPEDDRQPEFNWMNLPESWQVFVFVGIVVLIGLFVFWTYYRELKTCPFGLRVTLGVLRFTVLFLLTLIFLKPSISFRKDIVRKPNIVLALDVSASMKKTDEYRDPAVVKKLADEYGFDEQQLSNGDVARIQIAKKAIERNDQEFVKQLREKGAIRVNEFEKTNKTTKTLSSIVTSDEKESGAGGNRFWGEMKDSLRSAIEIAEGKKAGAAGSDKLEIPEELEGGATDIWLALRDALEVSQLSSVVLVSDGQTTTESDPLQIARKAKEKNIQIFTVGVGDPYKAKNIWIGKLRVPFQAVNPGDPFDVTANINYQRIDTRNINVELVRQEVIGENLGPEEEPISQLVTLPEKDPESEDQQGVVEVKFKPRLTKSGTFRYKLKITTEIPDEENTDDNIVEALEDVVVTDETSRVLLISGSPTWEYQLVQRLIQRDPTYKLSCWLQSMDIERQQEGNQPIDRLPETFQEFSEYNAIILIDPDPQKDLDKNFFDLLERFVEEKAGGVMFMAGPKYTAMTLSLSKSEGLRKILPVEFPDSSATLIDTDGPASASTKMEINIPNVGHQVMRFFQEQNQNLNQWESMPGVYWSYPASKAKPITKVLIEHGDITRAVDSENPRPLLVAGRYGLGNSLYMGFNGTWRWRRVGRQAHFFDAFWINVVKFLVSNRSLQASKRGIVGTDKPDFEIGERVDFHATVFDPTMNKMEVDSIEGGLFLKGEKIETLKFKKVTAGEYKASWVANVEGKPEVRLDVGGAVLKSVIQVDEPADEQKATSQNVALLREIATEAGGEYFSIEDLDQLVDVIPSQDRTIPQLTTPEPIWGMPEVRREFLLLCFMLPFVLLTVEWSLRKAFKLL